MANKPTEEVCSKSIDSLHANFPPYFYLHPHPLNLYVCLHQFQILSKCLIQKQFYCKIVNVIMKKI